MPRWFGAVIFFGVAATIWTAVHVYLYTRVTAAVEIGATGRTVAKGIVAGLALAYLVGRLLSGRWEAGATALTWVGALWMGFAAIAATVFAARDLGIALPAAVLARKGVLDSVTVHEVLRWSARTAIGLAAVASAWGFFVVIRGPLLTEVEVPLKGLPARLDGFRLVHLSDIHLGETVGSRFLERIASVVDPLDADLVVITGDLTDERDGGDGSGLRRIAAFRSRIGVFACTGNHEVYSGGQATVEALERAGIRVLRQSHRVVEGGLVVAGIDDPTFLGGRKAIPEAIRAAVAGVPPGLPVVLLAHQPLEVEAAAAAGVDLMLCGHTHGGQLPPFLWLNRLAYRYVQGWHAVQDMALSISRGTGYWGPPMRIGAPGEAILYRLRSAESPGAR